MAAEPKLRNSLRGAGVLAAAVLSLGRSYRRFEWKGAEDELGSSDKAFVRAGVADGFSVDFGHDDLLAGIAAPAEVFPVVGDWLAARSSP